jgi:hypothetical protein
MGTNESDGPDEDEDQSPFQHPGTRFQGAASASASLAQSTRHTTNPALGTIATMPFDLDSTNASPATHSNVQMLEPFFRVPVANGYPTAQHALFPERNGIRNSNNALGNTRPCHSSYLDLTDMALDSFAYPGYVRAMVAHAQATIDNLTTENHKLSADIYKLVDENEALKRKIKDLKVLASLVPSTALHTEACRLNRLIDDLDAQEEELMLRLHSLVEGNSHEHEQSENQDTSTADAGQLEHGAGDDDASSSSSITEGGIVDRPIKVEDATAAYEQRLEKWVPVVDDISTIPSTTVPVWRRPTAAELEAMAEGDEQLLA